MKPEGIGNGSQWSATIILAGVLPHQEMLPRVVVVGCG